MKKEIQKENLILGGISTAFLAASELAEFINGITAGSLILFFIGCFTAGKIIGNLTFLRKNKDMLDLMD